MSLLPGQELDINPKVLKSNEKSSLELIEGREQLIPAPYILDLLGLISAKFL